MTVEAYGGARVGAIATATPYPWPYHGSFHPPHCALVACLDRSWRRDGELAAQADENLVRIAELLGLLGGVLVGITELPAREAFTRVRFGAQPDSQGAAEALPVAVDVALESGGTSGFYSSRLDGVLRRAGCSDLILAGWGLEGPVHSTMRAANDRGYECLLVSDASTPLDDELVDASYSMVGFSGGIFGAVAATAEVLALLDTHRATSLTVS